MEVPGMFHQIVMKVTAQSDTWLLRNKVHNIKWKLTQSYLTFLHSLHTWQRMIKFEKYCRCINVLVFFLAAVLVIMYKIHFGFLDVIPPRWVFYTIWKKRTDAWSLMLCEVCWLATCHILASWIFKLYAVDDPET